MKSSTHKWIVIGILGFTVIFGLLFIVALFGFRDAASAGGGINLSKRVAVVRLEGEIYESTWHAAQLREYLNNRGVAGVLLRINSPGGAVAPSQELYNEVAAYRAAGKPLVVSMGNVAASGGYYIAAPAQKIFASPGTLTGSIGVIFMISTFQELAKKVGVDFQVLKAGELKDAGSFARPMTEKEAKYFQTLLDDTHEQFISDVALGREMPKDDIRPLADGRVFTGRQAYENHLIDTLGGYSEALDYLRALCGVPESVKPIEKKPYAGWREWFMEAAQKNIPGIETMTRPSGLYFLFAPL
jgi:protease-4